MWNEKDNFTYFCEINQKIFIHKNKKQKIKVIFVYKNNLTNISLRETFLFCDNLISMPEIPSDVINMGSTFNSCIKLVNVTNIPEKVTKMSSAFQGCTSLENFGDIPDSVEALVGTFLECENLKTIGNIGNGVKNMYLTFGYCSKLSGISNIPKKVENLNSTFVSCTSISDINITIPETANDITNIFNNCKNLQGTIQINANPKNYDACFDNNCATNGTGLTITGSSPILEELKTRYTNNIKIIFQ